MKHSPLRTPDDFYAQEAQFLAPYAAHAQQSRGRAYLEPEDDQRTAFQRDRDRILHSRAFRRLKGKTQVFIAHYGDHYRNRLTHTLEVAQLSRDLARNLGLNEDLAETIALGHDLGHTPFGHGGEVALDELLHRYGDSFEHNRQSRRIVETLETQSPEYPGLNLSWEVLAGLDKHRDNPEGVFAMSPLESQIVDCADAIAYLAHDTEDGVRSGSILLEELSSVKLWQRAMQHSSLETSERLILRQGHSSLIKILTTDLLRNTVHNINHHKPQSIDDVMKLDHPIADFSTDMQNDIYELRHFFEARLYRNEVVVNQTMRGKQIIKQIFFALQATPSLLPEELYQAYKSESTPLHLILADYISGMTDGYAQRFVVGL